MVIIFSMSLNICRFLPHSATCSQHYLSSFIYPALHPTSLSLSFSLSCSFSPCLSIFLSISVSLTLFIALSLCLSLSVSCSLSLAVSLFSSICLSISLSFSDSSICLILFLSHPRSSPTQSLLPSLYVISYWCCNRPLCRWPDGRCDCHDAVGQWGLDGVCGVGWWGGPGKPCPSDPRHQVHTARQTEDIRRRRKGTELCAKRYVYRLTQFQQALLYCVSEAWFSIRVPTCWRSWISFF